MLLIFFLFFKIFLNTVCWCRPYRVHSAGEGKAADGHSGGSQDGDPSVGFKRRLEGGHFEMRNHFNWINKVPHHSQDCPSVKTRLGKEQMSLTLTTTTGKGDAVKCYLAAQDVEILKNMIFLGDHKKIMFLRISTFRMLANILASIRRTLFCFLFSRKPPCVSFSCSVSSC